MEKLKNYLLASMGIVILSMTLAFTGAGRAIAQRVDEDCIRLCEPASPIPVTARTPLPVVAGGDGPLKVQAAAPALADIISDDIVLTLKPGEQVAMYALSLPHPIMVPGFTGFVSVEPPTALPLVGIQPTALAPVLPLNLSPAGGLSGVQYFNVTYPYSLGLYPGGRVVLKRQGALNTTIKLTLPMFGS
jgi:hypothetical protein